MHTLSACFTRYVCIFCTNERIIKLLSSVADWDIAGVLHDVEIPVDPQYYWQLSFITQTLIKQLSTWAVDSSF